MKTLIFVRHAKSSWEYEVSDKDRPLKVRGINDAYLVSNHLSGDLELPQKVFSSPANRALHTCIIFMRNLGIDFNKLTVTSTLYDFGGSDVQEFVENLSEDLTTVMLFGHNHAFTALANLYGDRYIDNVATSALVKIDFDIATWQEIKTTQGKTTIHIAPKALK